MTKVQKAYHLTLFAVALWGFTALLMTGEFAETLLAVCYALVGLAYVLHRRQVRTPDLFWNGLTAIAFAVAVYLSRFSLFDAAMYFFMYLMIAKLFTLRRPADARWLYLVAFFMVIGAAVLTTSLVFALIFSIYVAIMICSLMLFTINKDHDRVSRALPFSAAIAAGPEEVEDTRQKSALRSLAVASVFGAVFVVLSSGFLFTLIPRLSTQRLFQSFGSPPEPPAQSAFDESIEFGSFGKINLDNAVAMYVRTADRDSDDRPDHIRLRGVGLDTFNGKAWRRTTTPVPMTVRQAFTPFSRSHYPYRRYTIIQPPGITNYLFGDTFPYSLDFPQSIPYLFDPESNSAWLPNLLPKDLQYSVTCRIEHLETRVDPTKLEQGIGKYPGMPSRYIDRSRRWFSPHVNRPDVSESYLEKCLALPPTLDAQRIKTLSQEWTQQAATDFERARTIEDRFRTEFSYTLEQQTRGNFIEDFLFRARAGHCEYFATSMALMLRTLGIPARAVNGYYCTEWNDMAGSFIVRQRDAHSWVEAYLGDDYGWMTFDPTPASGVGRSTDQNAFLNEVNHLLDALKIRWYRYVIDFSYTDQTGIVRSAIRTHRAIGKLLGTLGSQFGAGVPLLTASGGLALVAVALPLVLLSLVGIIYILWRLLQGRQAGSRRRRKKLRIGVRFYREILHQLARRGYQFRHGQTPLEFARWVAQTEPELSPLLDVTQYYYAARFANTEPTKEQLQQASAFLKQLRRRGESPS